MRSKDRRNMNRRFPTHLDAMRRASMIRFEGFRLDGRISAPDSGTPSERRYPRRPFERWQQTDFVGLSGVLSLERNPSFRASSEVEPTPMGGFKSDTQDTTQHCPACRWEVLQYRGSRCHRSGPPLRDGTALRARRGGVGIVGASSSGVAKIRNGRRALRTHAALVAGEVVAAGLAVAFAWSSVTIPEDGGGDHQQG